MQTHQKRNHDWEIDYLSRKCRLLEGPQQEEEVLALEGSVRALVCFCVVRMTRCVDRVSVSDTGRNFNARQEGRGQMEVAKGQWGQERDGMKRTGVGMMHRTYIWPIMQHPHCGLLGVPERGAHGECYYASLRATQSDHSRSSGSPDRTHAPPEVDNKS